LALQKKFKYEVPHRLSSTLQIIVRSQPGCYLNLNKFLSRRRAYLSNLNTFQGALILFKGSSSPGKICIVVEEGWYEAKYCLFNMKALSFLFKDVVRVELEGTMETCYRLEPEGAILVVRFLSLQS
jgi:hypothetical protein